jgi:hypothetical protein
MLRPKQVGNVARKNLATVATVLVMTGPGHFNRVCETARTIFDLNNRTTVSRCLKALVRKGLARKTFEGNRTVYAPVLSDIVDGHAVQDPEHPDIVDVLISWRIQQDALIHKVPRMPGIMIQGEKVVRDIGWYQHLWSLPEVKRLQLDREAADAPTISAASNLLLDKLVCNMDPAKYRLMRSRWTG